jgi:hypothetical protein
MLELSVKNGTLSVLFPWKIVKLRDVPWIPWKSCYLHAIESYGLRLADAPCDELITTNIPPFHILSSRSWTRKLVHPLISQFITFTPLLEVVNTKPKGAHGSEDDGVEHWFDISTENFPAYYMVETMGYNNEISAIVYCVKATSSVIRNARSLDEALYTTLKQSSLLDPQVGW